VKVDAKAPFSEGVLVGNAFYLSGRIGLDSKTKIVPDAVEAEARNLMEDVQSVLARVGMTLEDLVFVRVFCSDVPLWEQFNSVYRTFFHDDMSARSFIGSGKLLFGARFELRGIALRR
jgi:2-iminobutanoate/2-iminopropanoate deaminase